MRGRALLFSLAGAIALGAGGCARERSDVIARVNNQPITQSQLCDALEKADNGEAGRRTLDSLIVRQLVRQEAKKRNIEVSREELDSRVEGLRDYVLAATGKEFQTWLAETGQTEEDITSRVSVQVLTAKLVLTDNDRQKYFEDNKERLKTLPHNNESVIYREIVVASKEEADAVRTELLASAKEGKVTGAQFAEVAEKRTLDPVERRRGGMAGWLLKGKSPDPKLEEALFRLKPGEVSEPLAVARPTQQAGKEQAAQQPELYRLLFVEKSVKPSEITLERNADVIEEWMLSDPRYQMQLQEFFTNLRAKADIQILSPRYGALKEAYQEGREARQKRLSQPGAGPTSLPVTPGAPAGRGARRGGG